MKYLLVLSLSLAASGAFANNVKDLNKALIQSVQKDLEAGNAEDLKTKKEITRAPASVSPHESGPVRKQEKINQVGSSKW
jgi:hypothetical protein